MAARGNVIIVEDEFLIMEDMCELCEEIGLNVVGTADEADQAVDVIMAAKPDFVLLDLRLRGEKDGVDVAHAIKPHLPATTVIFVTGSNEPSAVDRIRSTYPFQILSKPLDHSLLSRAVTASEL
ncbi:response regulator [Consotaella aegiceratis]|uniref:response regulator n=1 Tax=Consotaella aegiceratis TaxID=3097961 RepID=UPI002F41636B